LEQSQQRTDNRRTQRAKKRLNNRQQHARTATRAQTLGALKTAPRSVVNREIGQLEINTKRISRLNLSETRSVLYERPVIAERSMGFNGLNK
jgi:hypothetical protein